jgi:50S ribosomal subunit-associated GTPase HflX
MSGWGKAVIKDGIIIKGGRGPAIDWYSEEAKEQRRKELREQIEKLQKQLEEVDQVLKPISHRDY